MTGQPTDHLICADVVLLDPATPIEDGAVRVRRGRIVAVGRRVDLAGRLPTLRLRHAVLSRGLVNAHTHLALSGLALARPGRPDFGAWIEAMAATAGRLSERHLTRAMQRGVAEVIRTGTTAVGDIVPIAALAAARATPLAGIRFVEVLGFARSFGDLALPRLSADEGLAPHAPYSTSPAIYRASIGRRLAMHVAESKEEDEFTRYGRGPLRELLDRRGLVPAGWQPPGKSPVGYLDELGLLDPRALAIHATFANRADRARLAAAGVAIVTCPRSNLTLTGQTADVPLLLRTGHRVALGTDSLASSPSLSMLDELRALRAAHPRLTAESALTIATINGLDALGIPRDAAHLAAFPIARADHSPAESVLAARAARFVAIGGQVIRGPRPRAQGDRA